MDIFKTNRFWIITILIFAVAALRLISLPIPNFAPIAAMALFGAAYIKNKVFAFVVPLSALLLSDLIIELVAGEGFYATMLFVYGSFILIGLIGTLLRDNIKVPRLLAAGLLGSIVFFLVTNFGVWLYSPTYTNDFAGLIFTYEMALPFFRYTILGDLFYITLMFGVFELVSRKLTVSQTA